MRKLTWRLALASLALPLMAASSLAGSSVAGAEANGAGHSPALGWSSWSFLRRNPSAGAVEAQALAMKRSGLAAVGFTYVNLDDFWYECPGSQGPVVDHYGRWVTNPIEFPPEGSTNGIAVVAAYVHKLGLKFGLYLTPGISNQAVVENTPILGTSYHADGIASTLPETNYNCGGMVGIDYSKPGAQAFIDSWADELASWGVDYLKLDGVGAADLSDVVAWSKALRQTGRPIHLELSNNLPISYAATWARYTNGWRTGNDIECYSCESGGSSYPLTDWANVELRFDQVARWAPYGGPGAFNDYDSLELGNGSNDGLTPAERQTQMSLWALAASPLILGTDLTHLDPTDLSYLENQAVLAVDQDAVDAHRVVDASGEQVFVKTEKSGAVVAGLFNISGQSQLLSVPVATLGLPRAGSYLASNLWLHQKTTFSGPMLRAQVASHGVALLRLTPAGPPPPGRSSPVAPGSASRAGSLVAWGGGNDLNNADNSSAVVSSATPSRVVAIADADGGQDGGDTGYALTSAGEVWAWGVGQDGQLGNGTTKSLVIAPVELRISAVAALGAGSTNGYAVGKGGSVWAWGVGQDGQLGNATHQNLSDVAVQVHGLSGVVAVAGGGDTGYALRKDGTVWAWGGGQDGQLGDGTNATAADVPVEVHGLSGIVAVAGGGDSGYALRKDGTVWAWGGGQLGQLGNGTRDAESDVPVEVSQLSGVASIAASNADNTVYAIERNGTLWAWGDNSSNQLARTSALSSSDTPVQVSQLTGVVAVGGGAGTGFAVLRNGTVWGWGNDPTGGGVAQSVLPVQVHGIHGASAVAGGDGDAYAIVAGG